MFIGFFNNLKLGIILVVVYYFSNFVVGLIMCFYGDNIVYKINIYIIKKCRF